MYAATLRQHKGKQMTELTFQAGELLQVIDQNPAKDMNKWVCFRKDTYGFVNPAHVKLLTSCWFRPNLTHKQAQLALSSDSYTEGSFFVRRYHRDSYAIAWKHGNKVHHMKIRLCDTGFFIRCSHIFGSLQELAGYYVAHPLKAKVRLTTMIDTGFEVDPYRDKELPAGEGDLLYTMSDIITVLHWEGSRWFGETDDHVGWFDHEKVYVHPGTIAHFQLDHWNEPETRPASVDSSSERTDSIDECGSEPGSDTSVSAYYNNYAEDEEDDYSDQYSDASGPYERMLPVEDVTD